MRLFVAIGFDEKVRRYLSAVSEAAKLAAGSGNFSRSGLYHLTLAFLGETPPEKLSAAEEAARGACAGPFSLELGGIGTFRREGGAILWLGISPSEELMSLRENLCDGLRSRQVPFEDGPFSPHITLARKATLPGDRVKELDARFRPIRTEVRRVSLMESTRPNGILTYTERYGKEL